MLGLTCIPPFRVAITNKGETNMARAGKSGGRSSVSISKQGGIPKSPTVMPMQTYMDPHSEMAAMAPRANTEDFPYCKICGKAIEVKLENPNLYAEEVIVRAHKSCKFIEWDTHEPVAQTTYPQNPMPNHSDMTMPTQVVVDPTKPYVAQTPPGY